MPPSAPLLRGPAASLPLLTAVLVSLATPGAAASGVTDGAYSFDILAGGSSTLVSYNGVSDAGLTVEADVDTIRHASSFGLRNLATGALTPLEPVAPAGGVFSAFSSATITSAGVIHGRLAYRDGSGVLRQAGFIAPPGQAPAVIACAGFGLTDVMAVSANGAYQTGIVHLAADGSGAPQYFVRSGGKCRKILGVPRSTPKLAPHMFVSNGGVIAFAGYASAAGYPFMAWRADGSLAHPTAQALAVPSGHSCMPSAMRAPDGMIAGLCLSPKQVFSALPGQPAALLDVANMLGTPGYMPLSVDAVADDGTIIGTGAASASGRPTIWGVHGADGHVIDTAGLGADYGNAWITGINASGAMSGYASPSVSASANSEAFLAHH